MISALTTDGALELLGKRVDKEWLNEALSTPDGEAIVMGLVDLFCQLDAKNAKEASSLRVRPSPGLAGDPASGAQYATLSVTITRRRSGRNHTIPAGTAVVTNSGHRFELDEDVTFGGGELNLPRTVTATATFAGWPGFIPERTEMAFVDVAKGISGLGTALQVLPGIGQPRALKITTDSTKPHLFGSKLIGMYLEITACDSAASNVGLQIQIGNVNDGSAQDADALVESEYAWSYEFNTTTDAEFTPWTAPGAIDFEWAVRDWSEMGYEVYASTEVSGGRLPILDELAKDRGRPRRLNEEDDALRTRLLRAPMPPSPLRILRTALIALSPWAVRRDQIQIYELGEPAPEAADPYAVNFPAACGFISDLHCSDTTTPITPDTMAERAPDGTTYSPVRNPGLMLTCQRSSRRTVIVRCDALDSFSADDAAAAKRALFAMAQKAKSQGTWLLIYYPPQWSYP